MTFHLLKVLDYMYSTCSLSIRVHCVCKTCSSLRLKCQHLHRQDTELDSSLKESRTNTKKVHTHCSRGETSGRERDIRACMLGLQYQSSLLELQSDNEYLATERDSLKEV